MKRTTLLLATLAAGCVFAGQYDRTIVARGVASFSEIAERTSQLPVQPARDEFAEAIPLGRRFPGKVPVPPDASPPAVASASSTQAPAQAPAEPQPPRLLALPLPVTLVDDFEAVRDAPDIYGWSRIPPDTMGVAGPNHLMTVLNSQVRIQDKNGAVVSTVTLNDFWASVNGNTGGGTNGTFDPKVVYDSGSERYIFTAIDDRDASNGILLGVSADNNPTGTWYMWKIDGDPANLNWADFPSIGFNRLWIAVSANMFTIAGDAFAEPKLWVFDKMRAYTNDLSIEGIFGGATISSGAFTCAPCVTYGGATTLYTIESGWFSGADDLVRVGRITGSVSSPSWSLASGGGFGGGFFDVPDFAVPGDAPQLGGGLLIDNGDSRISSPPVFRHDHIFFAFTGRLFTPERHGIIWGEIDPTAFGVAPFSTGIVQDATVPTYYAYPSIAVDGMTNIVLGFSSFSTAIYASASFTGRQASDTANTMQSVMLLKAGEDYYYKTFGGSRNRWGDYSYTCVDPVNDGVFWTIQEYARPDVGGGVNDDRWGTWWGEIAFVPEPLGSFAVVFALLAARTKLRG
jgi:hypothetical protein